ncbi:MAG: LamG domain-containing protein [Victivallaceae bacterium]
MALYMRSDASPAPIIFMYVAYYDSNGNCTRQSDNLGSFQGITSPDTWQEVAYHFRPRTGEVSARVRVNVMGRMDGATTGRVWIDEVYVGTEIGYAESPAAKTPFAGTRTKVDALGNVEVYNSDTGKFAPFFPIGIYIDGDRPDWSFYSNQGFNTAMWTWAYDSILRARNAGLMANLEIVKYITGEKTTGELTTTLNAIEANGVRDNILFYYWDNESATPYEWSLPTTVTNIIKDWDDGQRPIYGLNGQEGIAGRYHNTSQGLAIMDIAGTYVTDDQPDATEICPEDFRSVFGFIALNNLQKQEMPAVIAQLNNPVKEHFRPRVFTAIAKGAKGIGFWRDWYNGSTSPNASNTKIEYQPWWSQLPTIRDEINKLLPIIRMPHWTSWTLTPNNTFIEFGTRDYNGKGYVIVTNEQNSTQSVTFTISGYAATSIKNFFTGEYEAAVSSSQFTVSIPPNDSRVYVLENDAAALDLLFSEAGGSTTYDSSGCDPFKSGDTGVLTGGAALGSGVITLTGGYVNCGKDKSVEMGKLDMTISAKIKLNSTTRQYLGIVTKGADGSSSTPGYAFIYDYLNNQLIFAYNGQGESRIWKTSVVTPVNLKNGSWHTVGVTIDRDGGSSGIKFYVDGTQNGNALTADLLNSDIVNQNRDLQIGSWLGSSAYAFSGQMDCVRIFKRTLSANEMGDLHSNKVFDMEMNDKSGSTTALDSSFFTNNGILCGNAVLGNGVVTLDGSGDYINCVSSSSMNVGTSDFTIVSRVRLEATQGTYVGLVAKGSSGNGTPGYALFYTPSVGKLRLALNSTWLDSNQNLGLTDGRWHTVGVTVTRTGNAVFYVDGVQKGSVGAGSYASTDTSADLKIGAWITGNYMNGQIDCAKVYKRALTPAEMANQ